MPIPLPQTDQEQIKALRLYRSSRIGPKAYHHLLSHCENFEEAFERVIKRGQETQKETYSLCPLAQAHDEYEAGCTFGAKFLHIGHKDYPKLLAPLQDAPPFLWCKGDTSLFERKTIAMIGSRNPSLEGVRMVLYLSKLCNYENLVIVSGLARGIDAAAHEAALSGGTIGVVAGGVDIKYPRSNAKLQEIMTQEALVVSEMPIGHRPTARDFPRRNRIIAGLSLAVLVVEATERSGTKLTVNDARNYGREIMAVPGHPFQGLSALPNQLIAEGAVLVRDIHDILAIINPDQPLPEAIEKPPPALQSEPQSEPNSENAALGRALIEGRAVGHLDGSIQTLER